MYDLPSTKTKRAASFGFGKKSDFTKVSNLKCNTFYPACSDFDQKNPAAPRYSFGVGREKVKLKKFNAPGVGTYTITKKFGSDGIKVAMKGGGSRLFPMRKGKFPNPDEYKQIGINPKGCFILSNYRNISSFKYIKEDAKTIKAKEEAPFGAITMGIFTPKYSKAVDPSGPSPATYEKKNLFGKIFESKYKSTHGFPLCERWKTPKPKQTPGPGAYNSFSDFGIYAKMDIP